MEKAPVQVEIGKTRFEIIEGDIADQDTDAVVTAAHWDLAGGQGTDGAIHFKAGPELLDECRKIGACPMGGAVITGGHALKARYVIHAVGPIWERGKANEAEQLASAYRSALARAVENDCRSISFPSISTGAFAYPMRDAAPVALRAILGFLRNEEHDLTLVRMVVYPREKPRALAIYSDALRGELGAAE